MSETRVRIKGGMVRAGQIGTPIYDGSGGTIIRFSDGSTDVFDQWEYTVLPSTGSVLDQVLSAFKDQSLTSTDLRARMAEIFDKADLL